MKLKSKCFIALLILCVLFTIGSVSAEANQTDEVCAVDNNQTEILSADGTFEELNESISQAGGELNLTCDYKYESGKICINKSEKFVLNGNGHAIEGVFNCSPFEVESGDMVIFKNLTFRNCNNVSFLFSSSVILNGVKFINCSGDPNYDLILNTILLELDNCIFQFNDAVSNAIHNQNLLIIRNSLFYGWKSEASFIINDRSNVLIESSTFENISSNNGAVLNFKGCNLTIRKSKFINLHAGLSGGAILGNYYPVSESLPGAVVKPFLIEDCEFINVTSTHDGGAIYFDLNTGADHILKPFNILNSNFTDCTSRFGGAMSLQGGLINIGNCNFIDNFASFEGGALFTTWSNVNLTNTNLFNNSAQKNAGAFYFDKGKLFINKSSLINNKVNSQSDEAANCIYAYDVDAYFLESVFDNGGVSVYADFATDSKLVNVTKNSDIFLLDNKNYVVSIESNGIKFNLTKNEIIVDKLPPKFDPRNYGWISPNKKQGDNYDCWAFATVSSIESSFLRATGVLYGLSQNYVQELQLKYYPLGDLRVSSTGFAYSGLGYALSWIGTLPADNPYDDRGMISDTDFADARIHVQDAMIIFGGRSDTIDLIKQAVLKYGPVTVQICENGPVDLNTTGDDIAVPDHGIHFFSIIGWDDNYSTSGTLGSWLVKDSLSGDFDYRSFDDPAILGLDYFAIVPQNAGICYIFENDIDYHVNYQTDLTALTGFDGNYTYYSNKFTSKYDEWIGAVGTYFNDSDIDYSLDVYVNGAWVHSQSGTSEFPGFRTIVLKRYIPVKARDEFKVVFHSNAVPYQAYSRQHYLQNMTFVSADNATWSDITLLNKTVCLKVYTVAEDRPYYTFEELNQSISESGSELTLEHDYIYDGTKITIDKGNVFTINGNGHVLKGINETFGFAVSSDELVIINNLTFRDCNKISLPVNSPAIFNNVSFIDCSGVGSGSFIASYERVELNDCIFKMNSGNYSVIYTESGTVLVNNSIFNGGYFKNGVIILRRGNIFVENTTFVNITSDTAGAINYKGWNLTVKNSKFINLHASLSAGAILGKFFPKYGQNDTIMPNDPYLIEGCEFINVTSNNDGGAIFFDLNSGAEHLVQTFNLFNLTFKDCRSKYGGAIADLGGILNIVDSTFENGYASFEGGAIYTSWADVNLINSKLLNNSAEKNAGAIYFDKGKLTINQSYIINNKLVEELPNVANAIYAHDVGAYFYNSTFDNGGISVYADFASDSKIVNVTRNDDIFLMDNKDYMVSVESNGIKLKLVNNEIIVDKLPPRFSSLDWGWVSPLKVQGDNDDCWAFATVASLESALLKATEAYYNLSQNYVQSLQLKYARNGDLRNSLTGFDYSGPGYALSWYGVLPMTTPYDSRGVISDTDFRDARIHVQDVMFIFGGTNDTEDLLKRAIMKYGSVTVHVGSAGPFVANTTGDDIAEMEHQIHFLSLFGWDDNYIDGDGESKKVWLCKDSLGELNGTLVWDETVLATDYYAIPPQAAAVVYMFENTIDYHVNYQTDLTGLAGFDGNYTYYSNEFISKYSELIGAVGTYFNGSGINYSFDIYVNGEKVHSQSGVSEFAGFRTIVLNSYVPVKAGDKFKVVFKSNALPYQAYSREHYMQGMTFVSADGNSWSDITLENRTVCLKVYTVTDDSKVTENRDVIVDYDGGSYFAVKVVTADGRPVGAGAEVTFTINGVTTTVKTDNDGIARLLITDTPNAYAITTSYKGQSFVNSVVVKQVLTTSKVTVKKTAKRIVLKATLVINGKPVQGKTVKFTFRGKTYSAVTNANGVAQVNIPKSVLNKLKNNKNYAFSVTYLKDTISSTVKALDVIVLKAKKVTVKKTAKKFTLKATLKINGKAVKGKKITFKFKGKTYKAKTNKKGIAKKVLKKNVIKKLKKGKTYKVKVTYLKTTKKTTVKVK